MTLTCNCIHTIAQALFSASVHLILTARQSKQMAQPLLTASPDSARGKETSDMKSIECLEHASLVVRGKLP